MPTVKKKKSWNCPPVTLDELWADPQTMLLWLYADDDPPTVVIKSGHYGTLSYKVETVPVDDEDRLKQWWDDYHRSLNGNSYSWATKTRTAQYPVGMSQVISEGLSSLGIKGGTIKSRIDRAIAGRNYQTTVCGVTIHAEYSAKIREWNRKKGEYENQI